MNHAFWGEPYVKVCTITVSPFVAFALKLIADNSKNNPDRIFFMFLEEFNLNKYNKET
jgi:hypothetical protein